MRRDGKATIYQIQVDYYGNGDWKTGYYQNWIGDYHRAKEYGFDESLSLGPRGDVWQETGYYGTLSLSVARIMLKAVREYAESKSTEETRFRIVKVTYVMKTDVVPENDETVGIWIDE